MFVDELDFCDAPSYTHVLALFFFFPINISNPVSVSNRNMGNIKADYSFCSICSEQYSSCELRPVPNSVNVSIWSTICQMCCLQLYYKCGGMLCSFASPLCCKWSSDIH
jgi:hypothetical protein